jgi:glutathione S-transferase
MDLELVSFNLCPFVQRAVIALLVKGAPHRISYIDLNSPPPWFHDISPFGQVPLLRVDGREVLFESAVIAEFIDDVTPGRLSPEDPLLRAKNRAWIEVGSAAFGDHFNLLGAQEEAEFKRLAQQLLGRLERVEEALGNGPYFNGEKFALVDAAFAPLFTRLDLLNRRFPQPLYEAAELPRAAAWSRALTALPAVQQSVVSDFEPLYLARNKARGGFAAQWL